MYQKRNLGLFTPTFGGVFENALHNGWNRLQEEAHSLTVPVNIRETEKSYEMQLIAPGIKKEDFKISVDKNILTIAYDHKEETKDEQNNKTLRTEFSFRSFKRSFTLNEKIDAANIAARYTDGILYISLHKKEEVAAPVKEITIN